MKFRIFSGLLFGVAIAATISPVVAQDDEAKSTATAKMIKMTTDDGANVQSITLAYESKQENDDEPVIAGKVTITGPDGKTREFDLSDPEALKESGITILQGKEDGDGLKIEMNGGALAGMARIFELNVLNNEALAGVAQGVISGSLNVDTGKFMIGVFPQSVPESLRSHLELEEGMGLIIDHISANSPAAEAGLQVHDIILFVDDSQITKFADLTKSVQQAGKEKAKMSLTIIRSGKEIHADVSPVKRPAALQFVEGFPLAIEFDKLQEHELRLMKAFEDAELQIAEMQIIEMPLRIVGPGAIMEMETELDDKNILKALEQQVKELKKRIAADEQKKE